MRKIKKQSFKSRTKLRAVRRARVASTKRRHTNAFLNSKDSTKKLCHSIILKGGEFVKMKIRYKSDLVRKVKW